MEKTIVKTDNYLLVVDDVERMVNDYYIGEGFASTILCKWSKSSEKSYPNQKGKIIAHLPLNDSPVLEGVILLPPFTHFEFEMEDKLAIDGHTIIGRNPKTTTNSQGQEVACGNWIYAD